MDPGSQWKELNKRYYKFHHYNPITGEQKQLDFYFARVAIAQWGGPVAATKNTELINIMKSDDILKDSIVFFTNSGKVMNRVQYKDYEKIVLFDYLEDEQLIILKSSGGYNVFDPFKGTKKFFDLVDTFKQDNIVKGMVVNNGFVVQTANFEFYYIPNAYEPQVHKMKNAGITAQPDHWVCIPSNKSGSGKVEVQIAYQEGGIIQIIEDERRKVYYNRERIENEIDKKLPDIRNIKMIALSPTFKFVAYLSFINGEWILSVLSDDFEASRFFQIRVDLREDDPSKNEGPVKDRSVIERPQQMYWCGDDCVVMQLINNIVLVGPDSFVRIKMSNQHFAMRSEVDGLRFISQKKNEILRRLPDPFVNVFQPASILPGAMLYAAYESFEQKNPIEDDQLRSKKSELAQAVMDCIKSGQFEVTAEYQSKLLKAASYGKTFLGNQAIDSNILSDTCRSLRVVNALRRSGGVGGRVMTFEQVVQLTKQPALFVQLLLRYNLHYLAIEVAKYLKFPIKFKSQIYTHWACCKVEVQVDDDNSLCMIIKDKIKEEKGVSFTEIAHRAIEVGKSQLALKLLDNEPSLAKRIPVLLWMANYQQGATTSYYEKALQDAISSRDSNLIYLVIMKFLKAEMDEMYKFGILSQHQITQTHLVTYLRNFDSKYLEKYLCYLKRYDECGLLELTQAYKEKDIGKRISSLERAQKFFEDDSKDNFYAKVLQEQIQSLYDLKSELDKEKKKPNKKIMEEKPLNGILEAFLLKDDLKVSQEFAKMYKIPERRYLLTRVKALIQNKNWEELDRMVAEKNKKQAIIPFELIADMLIKAGQEDRGLQMIMKMPDIEEQVYLLIKIGQQRHAAQSAINHKKTQLLYEIRGSIQDPSVLANIDTFLSQNQK